MAVNWAWDGKVLHQSQCPLAYAAGFDCLCMEGDRKHSHIVPAYQKHVPSSECACFPSVAYWDEDGDPVWVHEVIS